MSSAISSALAKLDGSLQTVQEKIDRLQAGLDLSEDELARTLAEACEQATAVRALICVERPDAQWGDRDALELLIVELEIAAEERLNRQRCQRLLDLANELDAGTVKHRSESRSLTLNTLRLDAVRELQAEAAVAKCKKELPGPEAAVWLRWACSLQDVNDATVLEILRKDFPALDAFAGEMEESYWIPAAGLRTGGVPDSIANRVSEERADEPVHYPTLQASINSEPPFFSAGGYSGGSTRQAAAVALAKDPSETPAPTPPAEKYCERCGSSYAGGFHVCPVPPSVAAPSPKPILVTNKTETDIVSERSRGNGSAAEHFDSPTVELGRGPVVLKPKERSTSTPLPRPVLAEQLTDSGHEEAVFSGVFRQTIDSQSGSSESGDEAVGEKWKRLATKPLSILVAVLVLAAAGTLVWRSLSHKTTVRASAAVQPQTAAGGSATTAAAAELPLTTGSPAANSKAPADQQPKVQNQNPADQPTTSDTAAKPTQAEILSPPPEAPKPAAKKDEVASNDVVSPGPIPGALPGAVSAPAWNVKDVAPSVPKLAQQKLRVSSGVAQAQLVHQVPPQYPSQARQERIEGTVVLQAFIAKDGSVEKVEVVSGNSKLTKAAVEAVKQWRYRPFSLNGEPIGADTQINVKFKLGD